jgi:hypothetical protein
MSISWDIRRGPRAWGSEALQRYELSPEKIELIDGKLLWDDEERLTLLGLLLENLGLDAARQAGRASRGRAAVADLPQVTSVRLDRSGSNQRFVLRSVTIPGVGRR